MNALLEHDREAAPGIPEPLPGDETMLWQGAPEFRSLAVGSFRLRALTVYFGLLLALHFGLTVAGGEPIGRALGSTSAYLALALAALGLIAGYARMAARASLFTITDRRIVIRTGVALPVTINLPFSLVDTADLRLHRDGSGDISIRPAAGHRVSWLLTWPMVKPWRLLRVQPVLRGVANAESVAATLAGALDASLESGEPVRRPGPSGRDSSRSADAAPKRFRPYPTIPLAAMVSLVVFSLVAVVWNVLEGEDPVAPPDFSASVELFFEDQADGSVIVRDALDGNVVDRLEPGTNGFVRATLRSLVNARGALGAGSEVPFTIGRTTAGRLVLYDPVSVRKIDLRAFGKENADDFGRFLADGGRQAASTPGENVPDADTAIAFRDKESHP